MFTRIKSPKYKVGKFSLNEYELRYLMLEIAQGKKEHGFKVKDEKGTTVTINEYGRLSGNLYGLDISTRFSMCLLPYRKKENQ